MLSSFENNGYVIVDAPPSLCIGSLSAFAEANKKTGFLLTIDTFDPKTCFATSSADRKNHIYGSFTPKAEEDSRKLLQPFFLQKADGVHIVTRPSCFIVNPAPDQEISFDPLLPMPDDGGFGIGCTVQDQDFPPYLVIVNADQPVKLAFGRHSSVEVKPGQGIILPNLTSFLVRENKGYLALKMFSTMSIFSTQEAEYRKQLELARDVGKAFDARILRCLQWLKDVPAPVGSCVVETTKPTSTVGSVIAQSTVPAATTMATAAAKQQQKKSAGKKGNGKPKPELVVPPEVLDRYAVLVPRAKELLLRKDEPGMPTTQRFTGTMLSLQNRLVKLEAYLKEKTLKDKHLMELDISINKAHGLMEAVKAKPPKKVKQQPKKKKTKVLELVEEEEDQPMDISHESGSDNDDDVVVVQSVPADDASNAWRRDSIWLRTAFPQDSQEYQVFLTCETEMAKIREARAKGEDYDITSFLTMFTQLKDAAGDAASRQMYGICKSVDCEIRTKAKEEQVSIPEDTLYDGGICSVCVGSSLRDLCDKLSERVDKNYNFWDPKSQKPPAILRRGNVGTLFEVLELKRDKMRSLLCSDLSEHPLQAEVTQFRQDLKKLIAMLPVQKPKADLEYVAPSSSSSSEADYDEDDDEDDDIDDDKIVDDDDDDDDDSREARRKRSTSGKRDKRYDDFMEYAMQENVYGTPLSRNILQALKKKDISAAAILIMEAEEQAEAQSSGTLVYVVYKCMRVINPEGKPVEPMTLYATEEEAQAECARLDAALIKDSKFYHIVKKQPAPATK